VTNSSAARGRRAGRPDTRAQLVVVARDMFLEAGYRGATVRAIAAKAGVDPALISYFFGSKQRLFGEALALRANPAELITTQIDGPIEQLAIRLLTVLLETWDDPRNRAPLLVIAQSGAEPEDTALTRGFVEEVLAVPNAERLRHEGVSADAAHIRTALLVTQLVGVVYARYVLAVEPVATIPRRTFIDHFAPALDAVIRSDVPVNGGEPPSRG
jgi:AcrR family transcriptional regulator